MFFHRLARGQEFKISCREYKFGQRTHKLENSGLGQLVFTKRLVVHKQIHDLTIPRTIF